MPLDRIITDPIISPENTVFTPLSTRPPIERLPLASRFVLPSERDPLVGTPKPRKPFYRARPLWLVPFALTSSIARGMTLASRIEVFTELSCSRFHDNYNHHSMLDVRGTYTSSVQPGVSADSNIPNLHLPSVSPPAQSFWESRGDGVEGDNTHVIPGKTCASDPAVQAGAARLQTIVTTTMGTLSALTTAWWNRFGERYGRTRVLAISILGLFLTDLIFVVISAPRNPLVAHSNKLLILAPVIEGLLGGWSSLTGSSTAYIADCTSPDSRATVYAHFTGVMFVGLALGPIIGAWLDRNPIPFSKVGHAHHPLQSANSVFCVAICGSLINLLLVLFILPESLPASESCRVVNRNGKNRAIEGDEIGASDKDDHTWMVIRIVKSFISPFAEFLPTDVPIIRPTGIPSQSNTSNTRKDWSPTFLALSLFVFNLASGLMQLRYLYVEHVYDWGAEQLSYYISFLGTGRAIHLLGILPFFLASFKPVWPAVASTISAQPNTNCLKAKPKPTKSYIFSEIRFDLLLVRWCMFVDFCSHALVVLSPLPPKDATSAWSSQFLFVGVTSLTCAGAGVMPAAQNLALCLLQGRKTAEEKEVADGAESGFAGRDASLESGKLLGAISALQAVGQTIIGPVLFGVIYSTTVASFPKAIFVAAAVLVVVAMVLIGFVRPEVSLAMLKNTRRKRKPVVASRHSAEERRGRSRVRKDLRGGSASTYGAMTYDRSIHSQKSVAGPSSHA